jgi:hypothetical protein
LSENFAAGDSAFVGSHPEAGMAGMMRFLACTKGYFPRTAFPLITI